MQKKYVIALNPAPSHCSLLTFQAEFVVTTVPRCRLPVVLGPSHAMPRLTFHVENKNVNPNCFMLSVICLNFECTERTGPCTGGAHLSGLTLQIDVIRNTNMYSGKANYTFTLCGVDVGGFWQELNNKMCYHKAQRMQR